MKKVLIGIFLMVTPLWCWAQAESEFLTPQREPAQNPGSTLLVSQSERNPLVLIEPEFSVGATYAKFRYTESKMSDTADLFGFTGRVMIPGQGDLDFGGDLEYFAGNGSYDGATQAGSPRQSDTSNKMTSLRGYVNQRRILDATQALDLFGGLGYRNLDNTIGGSGGYRREISYLYAPLGVGFVGTTSKIFYGIRGEVDVFLSGVVKTHLSDVDSRLPDLTNNQSSGLGERLTLSAGYKASALSWGIEIFVHHWKVQDSDQQYIAGIGYLLEPENEATLYGANVLLVF